MLSYASRKTKAAREGDCFVSWKMKRYWPGRLAKTRLRVSSLSYHRCCTTLHGQQVKRGSGRGSGLCVRSSPSLSLHPRRSKTGNTIYQNLRNTRAALWWWITAQHQSTNRSARMFYQTTARTSYVDLHQVRICSDNGRLTAVLSQKRRARESGETGGCFSISNHAPVTTKIQTKDLEQSPTSRLG